MDIMAFVDEKLFDDFEKMAEYAAMCPVDRMAYDANEKAYRDLMGQLEYATTEGRAQGRAQGRAEGRAEGLAEGEERGIAKATHNMILKMHQQGLSLDTISAVTGLSVENIKNTVSSAK